VAAVFADTSESIKHKLDSKLAKASRLPQFKHRNVRTKRHHFVTSLGGATVTIFPLPAATAIHDTGINE
jgi:hypothetical protein